MGSNGVIFKPALIENIYRRFWIWWKWKWCNWTLRLAPSIEFVIFKRFLLNVFLTCFSSIIQINAIWKFCLQLLIDAVNNNSPIQSDSLFLSKCCCLNKKPYIQRICLINCKNSILKSYSPTKPLITILPVFPILGL